MKRPSEEMLNAYVDDALDPSARAEVDAYLATDAAARQFVALLRRTNELAASAFAEPMRQPPPQALVDAILNAPAAQDNGANVTSIFSRLAPRGSIRDYALPLAACLALVVGGVGGAWISQIAKHPDAGSILALGPVGADTPLAEALEKRTSGSEVSAHEAGEPRRLAVIATFRDRAGRVCREVEVLRGAADHVALAAGVACRDGKSGTWTMEGAARIRAAATDPATGYVPSGSEEADALKGLLQSLGARQSLSPDEERSLLERSWK